MAARKSGSKDSIGSYGSSEMSESSTTSSTETKTSTSTSSSIQEEDAKEIANLIHSSRKESRKFRERNRKGKSEGGGGGENFRNFYRGNCNLIVNYLPQNFTEENLLNLFSPYGPLDCVKIMRDGKSGYSFGYGFVNYTNSQSAANAIISLNGFPIRNKYLKVSFARPPSEEIKNTNLYISNLPLNWTEYDLQSLFGVYGPIVQINLLRNKYTRVSRGVAFVRYAFRYSASRAMEGIHLYRPPGFKDAIRVKLAENHGKQKAAFFAGLKCNLELNSNHSDQIHPNTISNGEEDEISNWIRNLKEKFSPNEIQTLFNSYSSSPSTSIN